MISKHISYKEGIHSITAIRLGIENVPDNKQLNNMELISEKIFEPLRQWVGGPIKINSFFRCPDLNKAIGGSSKSQHCKGQALDLQFWKDGQMINQEIYKWVLNSDIEFDQMINEFDYAWIHISLKEKKNRKQVLEAYKDDDGDTAYRVADINQTAL